VERTNVILFLLTHIIGYNIRSINTEEKILLFIKFDALFSISIKLDILKIIFLCILLHVVWKLQHGIIRINSRCILIILTFYEKNTFKKYKFLDIFSNNILFFTYTMHSYKLIMSSIFWGVMLCSLLKVSHHFEGIWRLHLQSRRIS
jgi:hypothetical protein